MITVSKDAPTWAQLLVNQINQEFAALNPGSVSITGGKINGTTIGLTTPAAAAFTTTSVAGLTSSQLITTLGGAALIRTSTALTDGAGVAAGTLLTSPAAGNPTKWIPVSDNGTVRHIPSW